jgi:hypothetical protein
MDEITQAIERACEQHKSAGLLDMGTVLIDAFLNAKMRDVKKSVSLYSVSSDVEGLAIARAVGGRSLRTVSDLLATAKEGLSKDPEVVASVVMAALNGISRRVLEAKYPERVLGPLREELVVLVHAYLRTCAASPLL